MIIVLQSRIKSQDFNNKKSMDSEIKERELTIINKSIIIEFHGKQKKNIQNQDWEQSVKK